MVSSYNGEAFVKRLEKACSVVSSIVSSDATSELMGKHKQGKRRVRVAVTLFLALLVLGVLSLTAQRFCHRTADHDVARAWQSSHALNSNSDSGVVQHLKPSISASVLTGNLPLSFEVNRGQTDSQVKFISRGS